MPVDGIVKTVIVATALCFVCSMVVSFAAVNLKSIQEVNKAIDKQKNILQVAGVYHEGIDVNKTFSSFQPLVVDLNSGKFTDKFDPSIFDDKKAAQDPLLSVSLENDPASIGRRTNYATIYLLKKDDGSLDKVILPIHGYGLWSTLYGFIALENNLNDNAFLFNDFTHADINLMCCFHRLVDMRLDSILEMDEFPKIANYWNKLKTRHSYQKGIINFSDHEDLLTQSFPNNFNPHLSKLKDKIQIKLTK